MQQSHLQMAGHGMNPSGQGSSMNQLLSQNDLENSNMGLADPKRTYRKKKTWCLNLNITIETPELDHKLNESFEIEIGSNQRLKILQ